jgi:hypothetical protein
LAPANHAGPRRSQQMIAPSEHLAPRRPQFDQRRDFHKPGAAIAAHQKPAWRPSLWRRGGCPVPRASVKEQCADAFPRDDPQRQRNGDRVLLLRPAEAGVSSPSGDTPAARPQQEPTESRRECRVHANAGAGDGTHRRAPVPLLLLVVAVAQSPGSPAGSVLRPGSENGQAVRHAPTAARHAGRLSVSGTHFRERAAPFRDGLSESGRPSRVRVGSGCGAVVLG